MKKYRGKVVSLEAVRDTANSDRLAEEIAVLRERIALLESAGYAPAAVGVVVVWPDGALSHRFTGSGIELHLLKSGVSVLADDVLTAIYDSMGAEDTDED